MKEFIEFIAKHLVDSPEDVIVEETLSADRQVNPYSKGEKRRCGKGNREKRQNCAGNENTSYCNCCKRRKTCHTGSS